MFLLCFMHYSRKLVFFLFFVAITQDWFWNEKIMIFFVNRSSLLSFGLLFLLDTFELCGILILFCYFVFSQFYSAHTLKQRCVLAVTFLLCFLWFWCVYYWWVGWYSCVYTSVVIYSFTHRYSVLYLYCYMQHCICTYLLYFLRGGEQKKRRKRERETEKQLNAFKTKITYTLPIILNNLIPKFCG